MAKVEMDLTELRELESKIESTEKELKTTISTNEILVADLNSKIKRYEDSVPTVINRKIVLKKDIKISDDMIIDLAKEMVNNKQSDYLGRYRNETVSTREIINKLIQDQINYNVSFNFGTGSKTYSHNGNELQVIKETSEFANYDHIKAEAIKEVEKDLISQNKVWKIKVDEVDDRISDIERNYSKQVNKLINEHDDEIEKLRLNKIEDDKRNRNMLLSMQNSRDEAEQLYIDLKNDRETLSTEEKLKNTELELIQMQEEIESIMNRGFFSRLFNKKLD